MLAPDHLVVFDKLMPLAVGEEFLEGLRINCLLYTSLL